MGKKIFKKINDYLWEIPASHRRFMRVPARIYASEKILEDVEPDALEQLINVASLPGIVKYSFAMPDIHTGYGFVIGGVAATKLPEGVISPGGIGFDQNCTVPNTRVLSSMGFYLPIKDLEKNKTKVRFVDIDKNNLGTSEVIRFIKQYNNPSIYKITTESGEELEVTKDHPIQTESGMKEVRNVKNGEKVLIYPFKGVEFQYPVSDVILNEEKFRKILKKFNKTEKGNAILQILNYIKFRGFLPLRYNSPSLPHILKIMGFIFGDGAVTINKDGKGTVQFYGKKEDLEQIREDVKRIGLVPSRIYSRERNHSITNFYGKQEFTTTEQHFKVTTTAFALYLVALGTPYGLKAHQEYRVPEWIFNCPLWQKRLFLASFFGAELSKPSTSNNKYNLHALQFSVSKKVELKENAKMFLEDIKRLLSGFEIGSSPIQEVPGYQYNGKLGKTTAFRLHINGNSENLIRFFESISYEYNQERQREACLAASYLKRKLRIVEIRTKTRDRAFELYKQGEKIKNIIKSLSSRYAPPQFIKHSFFKSKRGKPRISFDFLSFEEYKKKYAFGESGLVWEKIEKIEEIPYSGSVFDITINDINHNFIANNFVVSNCGIRVLKTEYKKEEIMPFIDRLATEMQRRVPSGLGRGHKTKLSVAQIDKVLKNGVSYLVSQGYGDEQDIENCEARGKMEQADVATVSERAKNRGRNQLGTLGSGNHFLEVQKVEEIFDEQTAKVFGLFENQVVVMIHTGSRGLGHQNCTDYLRIVMKAMPKYGISLPDKELACVPFNSSEGQRFFGAMSAAANFAWGNRHMISHYVRRAWQDVLGKEAKLDLLYDVAHNIAKVEEHIIDGKKMKLCVHRKGATRAFPPGHLEIPAQYRTVGQPVLIPGSMGTASYILAGTEQGSPSFFSTCHGAGRRMSRTRARKTISGEQVIEELKRKGILVRCYSVRGIAEEAPLSYKDVDNVVEVVHQAGLAKKVARLVPLAVIKGE